MCGVLEVVKKVIAVSNDHFGAWEKETYELRRFNDFQFRWKYIRGRTWRDALWELQWWNDNPHTVFFFFTFLFSATLADSPGTYEFLNIFQPPPMFHRLVQSSSYDTSPIFPKLRQSIIHSRKTKQPPLSK